MTTTDDANEQFPVDTPATTPLPVEPHRDVIEPYSIFDKRQRGLIVLLVSTAATCEYYALLCESY
jgi:hypothetical protein